MIKRAFDIIASGLAMLVLSPLLLPLALVLRCTGEGEIFYRQERVGRGGKPFQIYKFATMLKNSPSLTGGDITGDKDPRVLPLGNVLRKTKLNELPQLWNIFVGDMSIIGPRPLTPRVAALFPPDHWERIKNIRPGLSGIGSIVFRDEESLLSAFEDRTKIYSTLLVPYKMALESWYAEKGNLLVDIKLIFLTVFAILSPNANMNDYFKDLPLPPKALTDVRQKGCSPVLSRS